MTPLNGRIIHGLPKRGSLSDAASFGRALAIMTRPAQNALVPTPGDVRLPAGPAIVRHWRMEDAPELTILADDRRVSRNLRDRFPYPYRLEDADRFLTMSTSMSPQTNFAIEVDGRVAGGIGYVLHSDVERVGAEVGYWLGVPFWGRGIVTAAVRAITVYAFATHPELERLYAVPFLTNPASARVLEKAGYRLEGILRRSAIKDGQVLDQWMYAILRDEAREA
jgi:RimJ/RimL family protein N-acetyltransferase